MYLGNTPSTATKLDFVFTAVDGQATFSGADNYGKALSFNAYESDVFVNGRLIDKSDYTTSLGTSVTFNQGLNGNDLVLVRAWGTFQLANVYSKADIDGFVTKTIAQTLLSSQMLQARRNVGAGWGTLYETAFTGQSAIDFPNLAGYDLVRLHGEYRVVSSLANVILRFSSDNGSTFISTADHVANYIGITGSTNNNGQSTGGSGLYVAAFGALPAYNQFFDCTIQGFNLAGAKSAISFCSGITSSTTQYVGIVYSNTGANDTAVMNAIRILPTAGNFDTYGYVRVEGFKK